MEKRTKVLCYLHQDTGRDVEILLPVIYYLEKYLNASVEMAFIYDIHAIYRKNPDVVLLATNAIGSTLHHKIAKYASESNISVFAVISEGNMKTDGSFNYWGHNKERHFLQDYLCMWSKRTYDYFMRDLPQYKDKIVLTGATGFDRYQYYKFATKNEILKKYQLDQYKKVITYAGWSFGMLFNEVSLRWLTKLYKGDPDEYVEWLKTNMLLVEKQLRYVIENNPDILFILKRHPNEKNPHILQKDRNEMTNLISYPNTLYLVNEEQVHDLINISDIWLGFESTTVIESWLMDKNKTTIYLNADPNFNRDINYKGTIISKNGNELRGLIEEFYKNGSIKAFHTDELINIRENLIKSVIGFSDGMNHIRTGYYLNKTIQKFMNGSRSSPKRIKLNLRYFLMYLAMHIGKYFYSRPIFEKLPKFKKTIWIFERFRLKEFPKLKQRSDTCLDEFHEKHSIKTKITQQEFWDKLIATDYAKEN